MHEIIMRKIQYSRCEISRLMAGMWEERNIWLNNFIKFMIIVCSRGESTSLCLTIYDPSTVARITGLLHRRRKLGHKHDIVVLSPLTLLNILSNLLKSILRRIHSVRLTNIKMYRQI